MIIVAVLLSSSVNHAQRSAEQAVLEAERKGCLAYQERDLAGIKAFLTDDYTLTDSHGGITTKKDDLDDFLNDRIRYATFMNKNMRVRIYGEAAVVTGQTVLTGVAAGKSFNVEVQFTDTLVRIRGQWKLAAGHVSRLAPSSNGGNGGHN